MSVWLKDPAQASAVRARPGRGRHRGPADHDLRRGQGAARQVGLRAGPAAGGLHRAMGILLAALVVIVMTVTGWRTVARDMAALNMAGVPMATCASALVREQVVLVLVGSVVGLVCGAVSSLLRHAARAAVRQTADPVPVGQTRARGPRHRRRRGRRGPRPGAPWAAVGARVRAGGSRCSE